MNLVLHHFGKEFRYLRLRWFAFLALLGFDLAVNMEWLLPMRAGEASPGWLAYLNVVVLLVGLSLLLSCPEDRPGSDRSFISTRPMSRRDYWLARVMIWLLLIVLPVVLQNGLYLALSARLFADVVRGMGERLCFAAGFTAWLLPMLALWQRKEVWKLLLTLALTLFVASKLLDVATADSGTISFYQTWPALALGWGVFALLSSALVWRHLVHGYSFGRRLALTSLAGLLGLLAARFGSWGDSAPVSQDVALVQKLAPQLHTSFDLAEARFEGAERSFGPSLRGKLPAVTGMKDVHVVLRPLSSVFTQAGSSRRVESEENHPYRPSAYFTPQWEVYRGNQVLSSFFPKSTLLMPADEYMPKWTLNDQALTPLAAFSAPHPRFDEPLGIETEFMVDWFQRDRALEMPVVSGASAQCDEVHWKILRVSPAEGPKPGALTLFLHQESRTRWDAENGLAILLHLPAQRLVRLEPTKQTIVSQRGDHTGWRHSLLELTWSNLLNHADGEPTGVDLASARLIMLRSRFLGQSRTSWKSPEIRLADIPSNWGNELNWSESDVLYRGRELKAFQERMATLKPPSADSSEKEARRYVYDLFSTASSTRAVYTNAAHAQITQAFEPLGRNHLPLLLELRSHAWPGWSNKPPNNLLERFVIEDQREALVERAPSHAMLADLVLRKGWAETAKRHKPHLLAAPVLPPGAETLLLAWKDDPEVAARLMKEARHDFNGEIIRTLDKQPETRPQIETVVKKEFEGTVLLMQSMQSNRRVERAAEFGSAEAFEICLRWQGLDGDAGREVSGPPYPYLLNADGSDFWRKRLPEHERRPFFRRLKVSDFVYVPEKRAWRFLKP
ncbi:MAG: hypothetical protein IAE77_05140 [Prosthecobacter sp.]|jgi:hypothetical protein|uniref:hypothetical protein n=1 Tax=Prosthecobacter sp. TaxID=1965333 RepID=UPI0019DB37CF|nr:hypothetical protein [Prosthecobacter sp.]MBE2282827.1 hypothetical protein [Prosthecobacter sp.]